MRTSLVGLLLCVVSAAQSQSTVTAIRAGRLVDPDAGTMVTNQIILVDSGRFKAIGPNIAIPAGAAVIDLSSRPCSPDSWMRTTISRSRTRNEIVKAARQNALFGARVIKICVDCKPSRRSIPR